MPVQVSTRGYGLAIDTAANAMGASLCDTVELERLGCDSTGQIVRASGWIRLARRLDDHPKPSHGPRPHLTP
ncbi:MAG: hypothetical protein ABIU95_10745 [Burkholderiales bacterium]